MRIAHNLFDLGADGIAAISTQLGRFGLAPAERYGHAVLRHAGEEHDISALCTRAASLDAQHAAMESLRAALSPAAPRMRLQIDWTAAQLSERFLEMPSFARQVGGGRILLAFGGPIEPEVWRLVDLRRRAVLWEFDHRLVRDAARANSRGPEPRFGLSEGPFPLASGVDFVEIQSGMSRAFWCIGQDGLAAAAWSLKTPSYADYCGSADNVLRQQDRERNDYDLVDPSSGRVLRSFAAPTRSKHWARPSASLGCERVAISHRGGTVDIVDGYDRHALSIRPFPDLGRTEELGVQLSHGGRWLGADGWDRFRIVDLEQRRVAEIPVPSPNMTDEPDRVLYDRCVLATDSGVAVIESNGLLVIPYAKLDWAHVTQPGRGRASRATGGFEAFIESWRRPAVALVPGGTGASWLYGQPDLPDTEIPRHDGRPMQLLARIDLAQATSVHPQLPLPQTGALYFFIAVDTDGEPLLDRAFNPAATHVLWRDPGVSGKAANRTGFAPRRVLGLVRHDADLPDLGSARVRAAGLDDATLESYRAWLERQGWADQPPGHRLGGYPTILQHDDLEAQAARIALGWRADPGVAEASADASSWRLLLQLDSDEVMMWGTDSGTLYFLIDDEDLARRDFSRVVAVCEGL